VKVVLVHHADAVGPDVDAQRPLSPLGRAQADWLAQRAKAAGIKPEVIVHSGKLRALQTAEYFWRTSNPLADFRMVRGLRPDDTPELMRDVLSHEKRDTVVVSHMPLLPALARMLDARVETFPLHGFIVFERIGNGKYEEQWREQPGVDLPT